MDELSEEDKMTVSRARKIQRFLSQPFQVAEVFTGYEGRLVSIKDTISAFKEILAGDHDDLAQVRRQQIADELLDVGELAPALLDGGNDGGEVVVGQHDVSGLLGGLCALDAHGHADVGALERRRVAHGTTSLG